MHCVASILRLCILMNLNQWRRRRRRTKVQDFAAEWKRGRGATCEREKASEVEGQRGQETLAGLNLHRQRRRRAFGSRCVVKCDAAACARSPPLACLFSSAASEQDPCPSHKHSLLLFFFLFSFPHVFFDPALCAVVRRVFLQSTGTPSVCRLECYRVTVLFIRQSSFNPLALGRRR